MTSSVDLPDDTTLKIGACAHRRGPEVHTFLFTSGRSVLGKPQQHKDDDLDADSGYEIFRKCPEVRRGRACGRACPLVMF